jgi:hypothetical protein
MRRLATGDFIAAPGDIIYLSLFQNPAIKGKAFHCQQLKKFVREWRE